MSFVASRDLRNHTADVLRRVADGAVVTVDGRPVAEIGPVRSQRASFLLKADLIDLLRETQADPGLTFDLERLAGDTTDDLDAL
jgi:prevent-host-death family protein